MDTGNCPCVVSSPDIPAVNKPEGKRHVSGNGGKHVIKLIFPAHQIDMQSRATRSGCQRKGIRKRAEIGRQHEFSAAGLIQGRVHAGELFPGFIRQQIRAQDRLLNLDEIAEG